MWISALLNQGSMGTTEIGQLHLWELNQRNFQSELAFFYLNVGQGMDQYSVVIIVMQ